MTTQRKPPQRKPRAKRPTKSSLAAKHPTVGERIIQGLREAVAFERGDLTGLRVTEVPVTARRATATPAPTFDAAHVKQVRANLHLSQPVFARALNVNPGTVRAWEQGTKTPSGPALRLLEIAEREPRVILATVQAR